MGWFFIVKCGKPSTGTVVDGRTGKIVTYCRNPFTKKQEYLGLFINEIEAHQTWLKRKLELAHLLAAEQTDIRVAKALIERYTNYSNLGEQNEKL